MFQCIIQQKTGWMKGSPEMKDVFPDIRCQLGEQLRCLDSRMDSQVALVAELQDYFRRRAEVELDYSKGLDKLAKGLLLRHREQKQRREQWPLFSSFSCWQQLICHTKGLSRDHAALADIFSVHLVGKMTDIMDDVQRIYRKCREVGYDGHEELLRVLHELHTTSKTWLSYQAEARHADTKLKLAEAQRTKLDNVIPVEKRERSKKYKLMEKEVQKRKNKCNDARVKSLKAHNEYVLCLESANTTVHKYFVDDFSDLIDCMDLGFHHSISSAMMSHVEAEQGRHRSVQANLDQIVQTVNSLDSRLDKQRFLESNHSAFMMPKKFELQCQRSQQEQENDIELQKSLQHELEARLGQLQTRITTLRTESEEVWKTMETAERTLLDMFTAKSFELNEYFSESSISLDMSKAADTSSLRLSKAPIAPDSISLKLKADRHETEEFYLGKFQEYIQCTNRIARLHAKHDYIRKNMLVGTADSKQDSHSTNGLPLSPAHSNRPPRRKRIGRLQMLGQPKLFGGSLEEYLESTNQEIPLIMKSCIRVINLYGLHHQGIFRVSGSQVEINNFRESFERGEDPLADVTDASDINSVAGVLKLYLRELREPLLPTIYFEHLMELAQLDSKVEFVEGMQEVLQSLPRSVNIVMRYLFAFLNHLSEFSDENMMDPYNLAICFGPTLVPVPDDKDQVQYQNLVNDLIKNLIMLCDELFPKDGGPSYEKFISREPDEGDVGDSPSEHVHDDLDSEVYPSEDESEPLEATVQFDFRARSQREVSLEKGQQVMLFNQVSNDWWRGSVAGHEGLIPDKYIMLKIKDEDREKSEIVKSDESVPEVAPAPAPAPDCAPAEIVVLSCEEEPESPRVAPPSPTISALELALTSEVDSDSLSISSESSSDSFKQSRELWRTRVETVESTDTPQQQRQKDTPDLVMDLPLNSSANSPSPSAEECSSPQHYGPDSPDMTAAERFAKQNQCTLKKKTSSTSSAVDAQTQTLQPQKPPIKAKPQVLKKPSAVPPTASNADNDVSQSKQ